MGFRDLTVHMSNLIGGICTINNYTLLDHYNYSESLVTGFSPPHY